MRRLTVLYDASCGMCSAARRWLEGQRQLVPLELLAADSEDARRRFPSLGAGEPEERVAVTDKGDVYLGSHAWIVCLWALDEYRDWSFRLARPALLPLARSLFEWVSTRRHALSRSLNLMSDDEMVLEASARASCASGRCRPGAGAEG